MTPPSGKLVLYLFLRQVIEWDWEGIIRLHVMAPLCGFPVLSSQVAGKGGGRGVVWEIEAGRG